MLIRHLRIISVNLFDIRCVRKGRDYVINNRTKDLNRINNFYSYRRELHKYEVF